MRGNTYSKKQSSEQISRKLSEFIKEIQYKNRNPVDNNVLKMLQEMETIGVAAKQIALPNLTI